jgi:hypothetical protein
MTVKKLTMISSAIVLAAGWQLAQAQPPGGGGGGRGGFGMSFDAINQADAEGKKDDYLTVEELTAFFAQLQAGRGGPPGGGGGGGGGRGFDPANIFASWDTLPEGAPDGKVTEAEFNNRPQGRGRAGGGPPPQ